MGDFKNPENVMVAGKAGMNNDPHHGHLDIGHFIVHWQEEYFIRDIGSGSYDEKYFDDMRFDYPQASSIGHNVVFVNGEKQISGKLRKQAWNLEAGGDVEEFETSDKLDYVRMNPTKAYPNIELKEWKRHIVHEKPEITLVLDEIEAEPGSKIEVRFHTGVDFEVKKDLVYLDGKRGNMALIPLSTNEIKIEPGKHASQFINATKRFTWIDYFDSEITATENRTIVGTLILPVGNYDEASQIAASKAINLDDSGNVSVTFSKNGEMFTFDFENRKEGLDLKN